MNINEISLSTILKNTIDNFESKHAAYSQELRLENELDTYWKFALTSLNILRTLNDSLFEPNANNCYISVKDEQLLNKLIQLTICFGIHYNLEDNVGISIEKLSKYGANITKKRNEISSEMRNKRLIEFLNILYSIKLNKREHVDIIHGHLYRKHLHDLIAALLQAIYSPNSRLVISKATLNETDKLTYSNLFKWLNDLFEEVDGSNLVSSLLMAQSSSSRGTKRVADWFTLKVGTMLTSCLIRPNSVMNVVRAVLKEIDAVSASATLESDWKKCDLVAQIICQCPRQIKIEDYIKLVAPQLLQLYFNYDVRYARHFYRVAGSIYAKFAQRWPDLTRIHLTNKIIEFFTNSTTISAKDLMLNLDKLHLVYVASTEPSWFTLAQLPVEIIHLVFKIYSLVKTRVNAKDTKTKCEDLLRVYIRMMPSEFKFIFYANLLKCELVTLDDSCRNCIQFKKFNFDSFDEDESLDLVVVESKLTQDVVTIQMVEARCKLLTELIQNDETQIQFMLYLFDEIKQLIEKPLNNSTILKSQNDHSLLDIESKFTNLSKTINLKIVYFTQIAYLIKAIDPQQMIENHVKIIQFCYTILNKTIPIIKEDDTNTESDEMIQLIFSTISVFTSGIIEAKHEVKQELQCLLPLLNELKLITDPESDLAKMAENLSTSISTYCGVTFSKPSSTAFKPLIEEIDPNENEYSKAIRDLNDPLIPVRAHGLVALRKLIDKKDSKVLENKSQVLEHFLNNVKFNDSYVYLAAINGLIAMAMYEPTATLDTLLNEYKTSRKLDVETQLKVGEALTKTVKNFNDLLPKYGPKLIDAFLVGCKNDDEFIRSSSLSNLGETCKLLNYSLSQNIHEIINCLSSLIESDKSLQVKRSAIMVVKMIIEGLKQENFLDVLGSSALPLYKVLSKTKLICQDEIVQVNCQLTTDYLNDLMKNYLFPKQKLEKEIKILSF